MVTAVLTAAAVGLVVISVVQPRFASLTVIASVYLALVAVLGRERTAVATLTAAFATAPMAKGLASAPDAPMTPTDLLLGLGIALLLPTLLTRPIRPAGIFLLGAGLVVVTGSLATAVSTDPLTSTLELVQWLLLIIGLVCVVALWQPRPAVVTLLLGAYVGGHIVSVLVAVTEGPVEGGNRYAGLTHHPNALAEAGLMATAALMYLYYVRRGLWYRFAVLTAAAISIQSVMISGSRAALLVLAVLALMIPVVERSVFKGFVMALCGALLVLALPLLIEASSSGSALDRLSGTQDATSSDRIRQEGTEQGLEAFARSPLIGTGFADIVDVHNVVVAVAAAAGLLGLVGFLMILYSLARPLFGDHSLRRTSYAAWAYVGLMPAVPVLDNRTLWLPVSLAAVCWSGRGSADGQAPVPDEAPTPNE